MANRYIPIGVIIIGSLAILVGLAISLVAFSSAIFLAIIPGFLLFKFIFLIPKLIMLFFGIISIIFGAAFIRGSNFARIIMIIFSILYLFFFPIGTIIGLIMLIYLFSPGVVAYFKGP